MALEPILTDKTGREILAELRRLTLGVDPAFPVKGTATTEMSDAGELSKVNVTLDVDMADVFAEYDEGTLKPVLCITDASGAKFNLPLLYYRETTNGVIRNLTFGTFDLLAPYERGLKVELRYMPVISSKTVVTTLL